MLADPDLDKICVIILHGFHYILNDTGIGIRFILVSGRHRYRYF
jgi:hypothetical protein